MKITSKQEFFRLWELGVLGNRPHLFRDPATAYASGFPLIGFRRLGGGGGTWERVPREQVFITAQRWATGTPYIMDSAIAPADDTHITLQGEVCRTFRGWEGLMGVTPGLPMRQAFPLMRPVSGAEVLVLLGSYMDPSSQDDLRDLLDLYPDATVEFTCFDMDCGVITGRNTLFWECRDY